MNTQEIINNLMQAADTAPNFDSLAPEQKETASLMLAGFDKVLEEIPEGLYSEKADLIASTYRAAKGSPLHAMAAGYVAGVCHGLKLASRSTDAENA